MWTKSRTIGSGKLPSLYEDTRPWSLQPTALVLTMTACFHLLRRCCRPYNGRLDNSPIVKHSGIEGLNALADIPFHLHEIIGNGARLRLNRINLYVGCIVEAAGFTASQSRQTIFSFPTACPRNCGDRREIRRNLGSAGLCRWHIRGNVEPISLISANLQAHAKRNAVRCHRQRRGNNQKSQSTQEGNFHLGSGSPF